MKFWKWFFILLGPLLLGAFIGLMLTVIYPSSMKVASFLCPEDKPDTFIVSYTTTTSDGTGTSFTLFCMSERGEVREIGTWRPMLVVVAITVAVSYGLMLLLVLWGAIRRIGRSPDDGSAEASAQVFAGLPDPPVVSQPPPPGFQ